MIELRRRYGTVSGGGEQPPRLPAGYQEVEYLEKNSTTSYIKLGINIKANKLYSTRVDFEFSGNRNGNQNACIDGYYGTNPSVGYPLYASVIVPKNEDRLYSNLTNVSKETLNVVYNVNIKERHVVEFNTINGSFIDGIKVSSETLKTDTDYSTENSFFLFTRGAYDGAIIVEHFLGKIYSYIFYEDGVAIRNLIPCRRIFDNEKGMYDIVNDVFYTNAGTGEFLCGPDVHYNLPPEYQQVEWIGTGESNELPHILTDIYPSPTLGYKFECAIPTAAHKELPAYDYVILGCDTSWNGGGYSIGFNNDYSSFLGVFFHKDGSMISQLSLTGIQPENDVFTEYKYAGGNCFINGKVVRIEHTFNNDSKLLKICIFGVNRANVGVVYNQGKIRIKPIYFFDGKENNAVAYLYPCYRKKDDVAGMYDIVNNVFYTNAGTGTFEVGPLVI